MTEDQRLAEEARKLIFGASKALEEARENIEDIQDVVVKKELEALIEEMC